ncbi:unnamed protein product [Arctogadus glacialis]
MKQKTKSTEEWNPVIHKTERWPPGAGRRGGASARRGTEGGGLSPARDGGGGAQPAGPSKVEDGLSSLVVELREGGGGAEPVSTTESSAEDPPEHTTTPHSDHLHLFIIQPSGRLATALRTPDRGPSTAAHQSADRGAHGPRRSPAPPPPRPLHGRWSVLRKDVKRMTSMMSCFQSRRPPTFNLVQTYLPLVHIFCRRRGAGLLQGKQGHLKTSEWPTPAGPERHQRLKQLCNRRRPKT